MMRTTPKTFRSKPSSLACARRRSQLLILAVVLCVLPGNVLAQSVTSNDPPQYGPYSGVFLADGVGLRKPISNTHDSILLADSPWSLYCWIKTAEPVEGPEFVAGLGATTDESYRYLGIDAGKVTLSVGSGSLLVGAMKATVGEWHLIAATFDGHQFHLYSDGQSVATGDLVLGSVKPLLQMAPSFAVESSGKHFGGEIAAFTVARRALLDAEIHQFHEMPPDFSLINFEEGSKPWPLQTRAQAGYRAPQDPSTLPRSRASFSRPTVKLRAPVGDSLIQTASQQWAFSDGWTLREAPKVEADGATLAKATYNGADWMRATVPGTVLTTMIDDGIYPDPDFGLNNLAIPESLNKQDYWYRNEFILPASLSDLRDHGAHHVELTFQGINYKALVWLNGTLLGSVKGAFCRGTFDVTSLLKPGTKNVLVIRISPPPHPGIPQEQSVLGGPGENGGTMELDGPTFLATEGWDWIPAIRDRNSGIWQPVTLTVTGSLKLGDAQVVTSFENHDISHAAVEIDVPVTNRLSQPIEAIVDASIKDIYLHKTVTLAPGENEVRFLPAEFPQLVMQHPHLWWPNGYGEPYLYHLNLSLRNTGDTGISDFKDVRFGVREISYELSLLDSAGHLRRVEFSPTAARGIAKPMIDVSHEGMREIPSADAAALHIPDDNIGRYQSHVASLATGSELSPSIQSIAETGAGPYLVLKVNGVRIAARGGNWGMDDSRKRVSREHLEPFFRLNRDAHLNIIRNWVGQSTEETFYDLADEYGMLVWNDFWESTQNYNIEAEDPALFLANASDTIKRFRNHPSIVLWCGRNEGVPQPIINMGLDELVRTLDGTRYYSPSSNQVNLQGSGPYSYQSPALYFSSLNRGFSVETGTPSMSTLESFESTTAKEDQWPIGDAWAYHDWHQSGNGDVASFMAEIQSEFGAPVSLEDFERKAQMLNYVNHRAIFEGMNANLWTPNSGRLLWMTQPAWPSTMWQILSSDYDTQASFYGTMKACEPLHVQLNLLNYQVDVINTTRDSQKAMTVSAKVYSLANTLLVQAKEKKDVSVDASAGSLKLDLAPLLGRGMVIVKLELSDSTGKVVSQNIYWLGEKASSYRELTRLSKSTLQASATSATKDEMAQFRVQLTNPGSVVSLANKLTLISVKDKTRILPAYFSDNYISLLPGETRLVEIECPAGALKDKAEIVIRGWNATTQTVKVTDDKTDRSARHARARG